MLHASTGAISGTPVGPAGTFDFTVEVTDSEANPVSATASESITVTVTPLTVTTVALAAATAGAPYSATLAAAGGVGPYSWSIPVGSLPAGLKLHPASGVISGTPTAGGNFTFVAEVTDSEATAQSASAPEAVTVGVAGLVVTTGSTLPTASSGVPYSVKLAAAGGITPYQWSLGSGSLPAGLKLKSTGVLSGTTTATGLDSFTVHVTDSEAPAVSATENVSLYVVTGMAESLALPVALAGAPYDTSLQPAGGLGPFTYAITAGSLPPGLVLQSDGEITGQASTVGISLFTVLVTDSENPPATVPLPESIGVAPSSTETFGVGYQPSCIAFDGANMWVGDVGSDSVTELSPAGATLGTFPAGSTPDAIAFDGANMWVADAGSDSVTELSPAGVTLGTFPAGSTPDAIAFDGANMWVADGGSDNVTELSPAGATLGTYSVGLQPLAIAFDGTNMWVADGGSDSVTELSPAGATLGTFPAGAFSNGDIPGAIAFDGTNMWVANIGEDSVTELPTT